MLDQFSAFGTGDDQWRWNVCPVRFGNRIRPLIVAAIAERRIDFAEQGSAAFAVRPTTIRSGYRKSVTALPSRKNSGLEATSKESGGAALRRMILRIQSLVQTGTVLFSMTTL